MKRNETNAEPIRCVCVLCVYHEWYQPVFELCILVSATTQFSFWCAAPCMLISPIRRSCVRSPARSFRPIGLYSFDFLSCFIFRFLLYFTLFLRIRIHARSFACMLCFPVSLFVLHSLVRPQSLFVNIHANAFSIRGCGDQYSIWMDFGCASNRIISRCSCCLLSHNRYT